MTDKTPTRLMFAGTCTLSDKKPGELWLTEARALQHTGDAAQLRAAASAFGKDKRTFTVGAVYEVPAIVDAEGQVTSITRDYRYLAMVDTPAVAALQLEEKGLRALADAKREEDKARKAPPYASVVRELALIVAAVPMTRQERVLQGIMSEVRREALDLWRKGQGAR
jgi:hypothetical protein